MDKTKKLTIHEVKLMDKTKKLTMHEVMSKWLEENRLLLQSGLSKVPLPKYPGGIRDLIDGILENKEISDDLFKKIGETLGKRWMRRRDVGNR